MMGRKEIEEDKTRKRKKERIYKPDIKHRNEKERELKNDAYNYTYIQ